MGFFQDMNNTESLSNHINRLRRRVRLLLIERYSLFGASAGAAGAAVLALLSYRWDELAEYSLWGGAIVLGALAGCVFAMAKRLEILTVAKAADRRADLQERLSSAISLQEQPTPGGMEEALVTDASSHIAPLTSSAVFRHKFGLPHAIFGVSLLALLAVAIIPQLPASQSRIRRQEVKVMKREGKKLVRVAKDIKKLSNPKQEELRKLAVSLEKLGKKMQMGRMSRKTAMLKANRLTKQLQQAQDKLARENMKSKSMAEAKAEMRKAGEELARSMAQRLAAQKNVKPGEAMKQLPSDKRLAELARKAGKLSKAERAELAKALEKYTDPGNPMPIPSELAEALAALAENEDYQKAMEIMQKLAKRLNMGQSGNMSKMDREALKKQLEMLAKALKDTDLDELARMMRESAEKLASMSPEELKKLAEKMKQMQRMAQALNKAGGT